jgi:C4-type Zn-finger protein
MKSLEVKIKCPKCEKIITGVIHEVKALPFLDYHAYCESCDYHIGESEWEEIS